MNLGIFAKTFSRPTLDGVLDAVGSHGLQYVQFNMICAGLPSLPPAEIPAQVAQEIGRAFAARGLVMAALSGTFNMIHPDLKERREGLRRLDLLAGAAQALGTSVITLCTGTRDPENMWRAHSENASGEAWHDLVQSLETALESARRHRVTLAIEPEVGNVMDTAAKARALLDHFRTPHLKAIMDPANLFHAGELIRMRELIDEAFEQLGNHIVLAHAKDLNADGDAGQEAAGTGVLDYDLYLANLRRVGYAGPLILHSLAEDQVERSLSFLRGKIYSPLQSHGDCR